MQDCLRQRNNFVVARAEKHGIDPLKECGATMPFFDALEQS